jgi:hypothetical protein
MPGKKNKINPVAFIAIGACYMGAGVTLTLALNSKGASAIGIALIGVGVMFIIIGVAQKRNNQSE